MSQPTGHDHGFFEPFGLVVSLLLLASCAAGCGTTREKLATQQLLLSDAVDRAVAQIDFSPLAGEKVYMETRFLQEVKGPGFVNSSYIISSLRQQLAGAGALIQDAPEQADYVVEARVGTLGSDGHDVQYGLPASSSISTAAGLVAGTPAIPIFPEISLARRTEDIAAAKVALFAYHRESRRPVWQSGTSVAQSNASGRWILGAGPFESGSIHEGTKFAGGKLQFPRPFEKAVGNDSPRREQLRDDAYRNAAVFDTELEQNMIRPMPPLFDDSYVMEMPDPAPAKHVAVTPAAPVNEQETKAVNDENVQPASAEVPANDPEKNAAGN